MTWGLLYFLLALLVTRISRAAPIHYVGPFLALASAATTAGHYVLPFPYRVILEICLCVLILLATLQAWALANDRLFRIMLGLVALDFIICASFCYLGLTSKPSHWWFAASTNAIFAAQCLCVGAPGGRNVVRNWVRRVYVWRFMDRPLSDRSTFTDTRGDR